MLRGSCSIRTSGAPALVFSAALPIYPEMEAHQSGARPTERVVFETDRHIVVGDISLPPGGYQSRLSDAVNRPEVGFIPLVDVEISPLEGGQGIRRDFIILAKSHIRLAYPAE